MANPTLQGALNKGKDLLEEKAPGILKDILGKEKTESETNQDALRRAASRVLDNVLKNSDGHIEFDAKSITIDGDPVTPIAKSLHPTFRDLKIDQAGEFYILNGTARYDPPGLNRHSSAFAIDDVNFKIGQGPKKGPLTIHFDEVSGQAKAGGNFMDVKIENMRVPRQIMEEAIAQEAKHQLMPIISGGTQPPPIR